MRSFFLLPAYFSVASGEESSSLIQLRLHRDDAHGPVTVATKKLKQDCKQTWRKACKGKDGLKCGKKEGVEKKVCQRACGLSATNLAFKAGACVPFTAEAIKPKKLCKQAFNQDCKKHCKQTLQGKENKAERQSCKAKCGEDKKTAWKAGKCTFFTAPVIDEPSYEVPEEYVCGKWGAWGKCSAKCGGGLETREFSFIDGNKCGFDCPHGDGDKEQRPCNTAACPVDCEGSWSEYSPCSATCDGGVQNRVYTITREAAHGGKSCPRASGAEESHVCSTERCETDCVGHWEDWSVCSNGGAGPNGMECGPGGNQTRSYVIDVPNTPGGCPCDDKGPTLQDCELPCCPVPCEGSWGEWGECKGNNLKTFEREVEGGYGETEHVPCYDTELGGPGSRTKIFTVTTPKACGGECCPASDGAEITEECTTTKCPIDCEGHFEEPCECIPCGDGTQTEIFVVDRPAKYGGKTCEEIYGYKNGDPKTYPCKIKECEVPCVGQWGEWSKCSAECDEAPMVGHPSPKGTHTRKFIVTQEPMHGGADCAKRGEEQVIPCGPPALPEKPGCNSSTGCPIPEKCDWGNWSKCSAECRTSDDHYVFRTREWRQTEAGKCGGDRCINTPRAYEPDEEECDVPRCPIPCIGHWSEFDTCTAKLSSPGGWRCGGGSKTRTYIVTQEAQFGGQECCSNDGDKDSQPCGDRCCEQHCEGEWGEWGECCASCGGGSQSRTFTVSQPKACNGTACVAAHEERDTRSCNTQPCPIHCEGSWSEFSECSQTCTDCESYGSVGTKFKTYTISVKAEHGGNQCPFKDGETKEENCNDKCCPVDCVGSWTEFSDCSSSCGNGVKDRTYVISKPALYGGKECPRCHNSTHTVACNDGACPVHCVGKWTKWTSCSKECDGGTKKSWFLTTVPAQNGGDECAHPQGFSKTETCNDHPCIAPCLGGFGQWSKCSKPCGGGKKNRTYTIRSPGVGAMMVGEVNMLACMHPYGTPIEDGAVEEKECNTHTCPAGYVCSGNCD